jgi:hypothetical protein
VEEKRHSSLLQATYQDRYGNARCSLTEEDLQELIEVPRLDDGDVFAVGPAVELSARERALQVALTAETSAHNFYTRLVEQTEQGPLRRLYTELAMMEDGHMIFLQSIVEKSTAGSDKGMN